MIDATALGDAQNDPMLGRRIENFAIVARLGEGGMGTVYRAIQIGMDRDVALKILRSDLAHDGRVVQRFHQEARATARLSHRNLATVYTSGSTSDRIYYIAMEHLDGPSLETLIARSWKVIDGKPTFTLERPRAVRLWYQIVAALAHAHRLGIVHRAYSPWQAAPSDRCGLGERVWKGVQISPFFDGEPASPKRYPSICRAKLIRS